ncbi:hypothetical protein [Halorubrum halodurans]|uniref:Uncharacterized protein n=1 Tax=Halorubrum halodurans TaxID=1383851 RepID=A0A256IPK0_9EURY|nr:hypothetical protein [Halorubrum halodurans]OYR58489.1 hypothetical protein DJ70_02935 [Halorubrum halodurans]
MSIETTQTQSGNADNQTDDEDEFLPNPERGCGYLNDGKAYLRADVGTDGELPAFVEFDEPIPFKEDRKRSYKQFPGIQFELSVTGNAGLTATTPPHEIQNHLDRLMADRPTGTTAGEMASFHSHDLLMSVGKTHYETADQFAAEAKVHGVNKAISVTSGNEPPVVNPGRTRLFLIHPHAVEVTTTEMEEQEVEKTEIVELPNGDTKTVSYTETEMVEVEKTEYVPGVFGYTYLTRVVYTEDADGNVPKYIQDYEATGALDVVNVGEPVSYAEQEGFDAEGNPVDTEQETFDVTAAEPIDLGEMYPALEAMNPDDMERADLGSLADAEGVQGWAPSEEHDVFSGDEGDVLAVLREDGETVKIMPSNNVSIDGDVATSIVGPYRLTVEDLGHGKRMVAVENTR